MRPSVAKLLRLTKQPFMTVQAGFRPLDETPPEIRKIRLSPSFDPIPKTLEDRSTIEDSHDPPTQLRSERSQVRTLPGALDTVCSAPRCTVPPMVPLVVILGAGASRGSGQYRPSSIQLANQPLVPPLTVNLFDERRYDEVLSRYDL
jgi:hypothetical protein